jgi:organic radical activating enzyme
MKLYSIKEIFPTVQGEGSLTGTPAIFVRLTGCNLWSGKEEHRAKGRGSCSLWCDTDFYKGDKKSSEEIVSEVNSYTKDWSNINPLVVLTGGEPFLQLSNSKLDLIDSLIANGNAIAVETNGTILNEASSILSEYGHITLSPKMIKSKPKDISHIKLQKCTDLKIVVPTAVPIEDVLNKIQYKNLYFQPKDEGDNGIANVELALRLATRYEGRISVQTHKMIGLR